MTQIAFLQRYNNDYNKQKLANLEFALAKENALYQKQTEATKAQLELQNENDRIAYEKKRDQLQAELDEELAFMNKHRADLLEVQDWILKDEIEKLKERYIEQQKSYEEQAVGAGVGGAQVGESFMEGLIDELSGYEAAVGKVSAELGDTFGETFEQKIVNFAADALKWVIDTVHGVAEWFNRLPQEISNYFQGLGERINVVTDVIKNLINPGFAEGGYTGSGPANEVAGVVHRGEYVLPQEMVDQNTGTPKALGNTYVINVSGTFATSAAERRKVADQIVAAINQNNKSRLEASWQ